MHLKHAPNALDDTRATMTGAKGRNPASQYETGIARNRQSVIRWWIRSRALYTPSITLWVQEISLVIQLFSSKHSSCNSPRHFSVESKRQGTVLRPHSRLTIMVTSSPSFRTLVTPIFLFSPLVQSILVPQWFPESFLLDPALRRGENWIIENF